MLDETKLNCEIEATLKAWDPITVNLTHKLNKEEIDSECQWMQKHQKATKIGPQIDTKILDKIKDNIYVPSIFDIGHEILVSVIPKPDDAEYIGMPIMRVCGSIQAPEQLQRQVSKAMRKQIQARLLKEKVKGYVAIVYSGPFMKVIQGSKVFVKLDLRAVRRLETTSFEDDDYYEMVVEYWIGDGEGHRFSVELSFDDVVDRDVAFLEFSVWRFYWFYLLESKVSF